MPTQKNRNEEEVEVSVPYNLASTLKNPFATQNVKKVSVDSQLNPNLTFANFIEGECNRLARSASLAVASRPGGTSFNPLFIYGGVGLGKTHLAQAVGNQVRESFKTKTVLYVT